MSEIRYITLRKVKAKAGIDPVLFHTDITLASEADVDRIATQYFESDNQEDAKMWIRAIINKPHTTRLYSKLVHFSAYAIGFAIGIGITVSILKRLGWGQ